MVVKVSDYISTPDKTEPGIKLLDAIGDYMKEEIKDACTLMLVPVPPIYYTTEPDYTGLIRQAAIDYAETLDDIVTDYGNGVILTRTPKDDILGVLEDDSSRLMKLISTLEGLFTGTQNAAIAQFNTPQPVPPNALPYVGCPPAFSYVSGTYQVPIQVAMGELIPLCSNAFESFIATCYTALGVC